MLPELAEILTHAIREATAQTEELLALEDKGWIKFGTGVADSGVSETERITAVREARVYGARDPLAVQSIRLWTTYAFGIGMTFDVPDDTAKKVVQAFWTSPFNRGVLSPAGQRKSSDRTLTDGEIFFAVFIDSQKNARIRRIDTLEITEIVTDPDDSEDVRYYKRVWHDTANKEHTAYFRSATNLTDEATKDSKGNEVSSGSGEDTKGAVVFHLAINTIGQRGNSLLLPALHWIFLHRRFLASRAAIMLAQARFAWRGKVKGGQAAVDAFKGSLDGKSVEAGAIHVSNEGVDLSPYSPNSRAMNAYQDARMLKQQVCAAVGWPEPYFGDISIGNWATAKTTELPVMKQIQTYQDSWQSLFDEIDRYVMAQNAIPEENRYVDRDFPAITPEDAGELAKALSTLAVAYPQIVDVREVVQQVLMACGVDDVNKVLDELYADEEGMEESARDLRLTAELITLLEDIRKRFEPDDNRNGHGAEDMRVVRREEVGAT